MAGTPTPRKTLPHTLVTLQGTLFAGSDQAEIWQCGIRCVTSGSHSGSLPDPQLFADTAGPQIATWFAAKDSVLTTFGMLTSAQLTLVKAATIGADALYANTNGSELGTYAPPTAVIGTSSVAAFPPIITLAASFVTGKRAGLGAKGRIYLPFAIPTVTSERTLSSSPSAVVRRVAALLTILNNNGAEPHVISILKASDPRTPVSSLITGVRSGDVLDVQRRRKNKIRENYVSANWP